MSTLVLSASDRGKTYEVQVGDLIAIHLAENPTTGYRWEISGMSNQRIEFRDSDYEAAPGTQIGGGGTRTFNFRAIAVGTSQIQLTRQRTWQSEDSAIEQFTVNIQIQ